MHEAAPPTEAEAHDASATVDPLPPDPAWLAFQRGDFAQARALVSPGRPEHAKLTIALRFDPVHTAVFALCAAGWLWLLFGVALG